MSELLGLLSDSHGRADTTAEAVRILIAAGATRLIHLGDIGSDEVLDALAGHPAHIVFGNCDLDEASLERYARSLQIAVDHPLGRLDVNGAIVAFTHGHLDSAMQEAMSWRPRYLLHGHTHETRDERVRSTRIINPGALFRATRHTVALLDPARDDLKFIQLDG